MLNYITIHKTFKKEMASGFYHLDMKHES